MNAKETLQAIRKEERYEITFQLSYVVPKSMIEKGRELIAEDINAAFREGAFSVAQSLTPKKTEEELDFPGIDDLEYEASLED